LFEVFFDAVYFLMKSTYVYVEWCTYHYQFWFFNNTFSTTCFM